MKLTELPINQKLIVQLLWGEKTIEFPSRVVENDNQEVYISPYLHEGNELELNVSGDKGVICNIFTDNPINKQRISWKNVELQTVKRNEGMTYHVKTFGFNNIARQDERRQHDRIVIHHNAVVTDRHGNMANVIVHDISDNGISFYAPKDFEPQSPQLELSWGAEIDGKPFNVKVECSITRTTLRAGNKFIGCKNGEDNKEYLLYCFLMKLKNKKQA